MFGLPAVAYAASQGLALALGVRPPGPPVVVDNRQVAFGPGGPGVWLAWLVLTGLATAAVVGVQAARAAQVLGAAPVIPRWHALRRGAWAFGRLVLVYSPLLGAIALTPLAWLAIMVSYSGSPVEDMRPIGLLMVVPLSLAGLIVLPLIGVRSALVVPVAVLEPTRMRHSGARSAWLRQFRHLGPALALTGLGLTGLTVALIALARAIPAGFVVEFGLGGWAWLVLAEPVHLTVVTALYRQARQREVMPYAQLR
jgi:hypothetical protein